MKKIQAFIIALCLALSCSVNVSALKYYTMTPTQSEYSLNVDFGPKLTKQEEEGYAFLPGDNNYQRYLSARNELPDEVPVIMPFEINAKRSLFVSLDGDDKNPGTIDKPFATIQRALDEVAASGVVEKASGTVIYLREGNYTLTSTLKINESHCDRINNAALFISAYNGEKVTIAASRSIKGDIFELVSEENTDAETLKRIHENALGNVYVADYKDIGINKIIGFDVYGGWRYGDALFIQNGTKLSLARYPNTGTDYIEEILDDAQNAEAEAIWKPEDKSVFGWKNTGKIGIFGQAQYSWFVYKGIIKIDEAAKTLAVKRWGGVGAPFSKNLINHPAVRSHYYYYNVLEELDIPGEWVGEDDIGKLFVYPIGGEIKPSDEFELTAEDVGDLIRIENASNVVINGITMACAYNGVVVNDSSQVVLQNCAVKNMTNIGVGFYNTYKCGVTTSVIDGAARGVNIQAEESISDFSPKRNFLQNSLILNTEKQEVFCLSYGNILSHNLIENFTGVGIYVEACENIIEYNEFRMGQLQGSEGGGMYNGGKFLNQYNHIRYNYFHDFRPPLLPKEGFMASTDDLGESQYYYGNIFTDTYSALGAHAGDQHIFDGNIIINCSYVLNNGDDYYDTHKLGAHALNDGLTSPFMSHYTETKLHDSKAWRNRYPHVIDRVDWFVKLSEQWDKGNGSLETDDAIFYRTDTGCYYLNNIKVNSGNIQDWGTSPKGENYLVTDVDLNENPYAEIPQFDDRPYCDYNVWFNNNEYDSFDLSTVEYYDRIGLLSEFGNLDDDDITDIIVTVPGNTEETICAAEVDFLWIKNNADDYTGNYYRFTIARDENFEDIEGVLDTKITEPYCKFAPSESGRYYYKIEMYSVDREDFGKLVATSPIYTFDFEKQEVIIPVDAEIPYGTPVMDGVMDDIYNDKASLGIVLGSIAGVTTETEETKNSGDVYFAWDNDYLYVYGVINDDVVRSAGSEYVSAQIDADGNPWKNDALEMYLEDNKIALDAFGTSIYTHKNQVPIETLQSLPFATAFTADGNIIGFSKDIDKNNIEANYVYEGANGYIIEMALPLKEICGKVRNGAIIHVGTQNNDFREVTPGTYFTAYSVDVVRTLRLIGGPKWLEATDIFQDLDKDAWYAESVNRMYEEEIFIGTSESTFEPEAQMTRAMFLTMLAKMSSAEVEAADDIWYQPYVEWAKELGILADVYEDNFDADVPISREEAATLIYNYAKATDKVFGRTEQMSFDDAEEISDWAKEAVNRVQMTGIMQGVSKSIFDPKGILTRAQACEIARKYMDYNYVEYGGLWTNDYQ